MQDYGIDKYFQFFFSIYNPIFLALIFFLLLFVVIYVSYRHIYHPLIVKHRKEKEDLELKSVKLLTLFTELDPNPILKIDPNGLIVGMNKSAKEKFNLESSLKNKINVIIESYDFNLKDLIDHNNSVVISKVIQGKHYAKSKNIFPQPLQHKRNRRRQAEEVYRGSSSEAYFQQCKR